MTPPSTTGTAESEGSGRKRRFLRKMFRKRERAACACSTAQHTGPIFNGGNCNHNTFITCCNSSIQNIYSGTAQPPRQATSDDGATASAAPQAPTKDSTFKHVQRQTETPYSITPELSESSTQVTEPPIAPVPRGLILGLEGENRERFNEGVDRLRKFHADHGQLGDA